jgi:hypothetical protein
MSHPIFLKNYKYLKKFKYDNFKNNSLKSHNFDAFFPHNSCLSCIGLHSFPQVVKTCQKRKKEKKRLVPTIKF